MGTTELIKTVRNLDQTGPGPDGENLHILWKYFSEASQGQFHAAEESTLRWLLKCMNGTSPSAEVMRRYPLCWTILDLTSQKIPLFSLAKSLADRRFVAVLQQGLQDVAHPSQEPITTSNKRKRTAELKFDLEYLKSTESCVATAQAIFKVLKSLLDRLDASTAGPRDKLGAEHIKSLFCSSAAEAATIASPALAICDLLLSWNDCEEIEGRENWISTISAIWDFHLQGTDDMLEVATHLFKPAASALGKLESISEPRQHDFSVAFSSRWRTDLQKLMHRNFILPTRSSFLARQYFEPITRSLDIAQDETGTPALVLYFLAASASDPVTEQDMRKTQVTWMRRIFEAVEAQIKLATNPHTLMENVLLQAIQNSAAIEIDALRQVCRTYGLREGQINWSLITNATLCNSDLFQISEEGKDLLTDVCDQMTLQPTEIDYEAQRRLINAIRRSFITRRDFSGFLRLWFTQLKSSEQQNASNRSPWFDVGRDEVEGESVKSHIESELSPQQLLGILEWLKEQDPSLFPEAVCLFTTVIAQGLHSESFVNAVGQSLFELVSSIKSSSTLTALRWRTISQTITWSLQADRIHIWAQVKDQLSKQLKKSPLKTAETFEALKCCVQTWDEMSQDGEAAAEPVKLIEKFNKRLMEEVSSQDILGFLATSASFNIDAETEYNENLGLLQYLAWFLTGSSRFCRLYSLSKGGLPSVLETVASTKTTNLTEPPAFWETLLHNEININNPKLSQNLLDRVIVALGDSEKGKGWPGAQSQTWIQILSSISIEAFSRSQREQIMALLDKRRKTMVKSPKKVSLEGWKLVLDLSAKMMTKPTFYDGVKFSHLVEVADGLSGLAWAESTMDETLLEVIERFFLMASMTVRQMSENIDERSIRYFTESLDFISEYDAKKTEEISKSLPFRITLFKVLALELRKSSAFQNHTSLGMLSDSAERLLTRHIATVLNGFIKDENLLAKHDALNVLSLFAAVDAASSVTNLAGLSTDELFGVQKLEKRSKEKLQDGDLKAWKIQCFLHSYLSEALETPRPTQFAALDALPAKSRNPLLKEYVTSIIANLDLPTTAEYLKDLISELRGGCDTDGQLLAIHRVVIQLIERTDLHGKADGVDLAAAQAEMMLFISKHHSQNISYACDVILALLEKKPQAMSQWNVELTLSIVASLASTKDSHSQSVPFTWLCKLVATIIKRHRLRLEGRYHLVLTTLESLLHNLVTQQETQADGTNQASMASLYGRLITLICEPTSGAVSRAQHQNSLDSATDAVKRSAGRHMYLILMQYVKLQLEVVVSNAVREALEPAMHSILDITPSETRKILNDAMDSSGRAILREMFKRYVKFGKWSGV